MNEPAQIRSIAFTDATQSCMQSSPMRTSTRIAGSGNKNSSLLHIEYTEMIASTDLLHAVRALLFKTYAWQPCCTHVHASHKPSTGLISLSVILYRLTAEGVSNATLLTPNSCEGNLHILHLLHKLYAGWHSPQCALMFKHTYMEPALMSGMQCSVNMTPKVQQRKVSPG